MPVHYEAYANVHGLVNALDDGPMGHVRMLDEGRADDDMAGHRGVPAIIA